MGTRALVKVKDGKSVILCIYRQMDGYPEALGKELEQLIAGARIVNGYNRDMASPQHFNGIGCFAAYLVARLKITGPYAKGHSSAKSGGIGNVYIMPPNSKDVGEEYTYVITEKNGKLQMKVN